MLAPAPHASAHDEQFWAAAKAGRLLLQRSKSTGVFQYWPRGHSLATGTAEDLEWTQSTGMGSIHTFSVVRRSFFANLTAPYVIAVVELDEGVRVTTHVEAGDPEEVYIGLRVRLVLRQTSDGPNIVAIYETSR